MCVTLGLLGILVLSLGRKTLDFSPISCDQTRPAQRERGCLGIDYRIWRGVASVATSRMRGVCPRKWVVDAGAPAVTPLRAHCDAWHADRDGRFAHCASPRGERVWDGRRAPTWTRGSARGACVTVRALLWSPGHLRFPPLLASVTV